MATGALYGSVLEKALYGTGLVGAQYGAADEFYHRSNFYATGEYYHRTNVFGANTGILTTPAITMSGGTGIVYARTVGASIDTTDKSAFYNLDFLPVDGDIVELPTVWQGSTITVSARGFITISPALPYGTQMPRRSYRVSTGIWYQDTITINDTGAVGNLFLSGVTLAGSGAVLPRTTGAGDLLTPEITLAGTGYAVPRTTGAGDLQTPAISLSGVGSLTTTIPGTGALNAPAITLSGAGVSFAVVVGTGALQTPEISLSGVGSVTTAATGIGSLFAPAISLSGSGLIILPDMPVIADGGDLTVHLPAYSVAACVDYPEISAWVASFSSSVKVGNNLPILPLAANTPQSVTFSASNQFGTTTLTRTLSFVIDEMVAPMDTNQADLRLNFPYFNDPNFFTYLQLDLAITAARGQIPATNYGRIQGPTKLRAIYLLAAHMLYVQRQAMGGGTAGVVTSSTVDKVSVMMMTPPAKTQWAWWLSQSPYGVELQGLLATKSAGGFYVPGSIERMGFRKGGGGF